jgi:hypothetical protein
MWALFSDPKASACLSMNTLGSWEGPGASGRAAVGPSGFCCKARLAEGAYRSHASPLHHCSPLVARQGPLLYAAVCTWPSDTHFLLNTPSNLQSFLPRSAYSECSPFQSRGRAWPQGHSQSAHQRAWEKPGAHFQVCPECPTSTTQRAWLCA